jgi:hypothetical protein
MTGAHWISFLLLSQTPAASPSSHCGKHEQSVFSCSVSGGKHLSVCASSGIGKGNDDSLHYRFGRLGAVELQYPSTSGQGHRPFRFERYTRPSPMATTELKMHFQNQGWQYTVFHYSHCEVEAPSSSPTGSSESPKQQCSERSGVSLQQGSREAIEVLCTGPVQNADSFFNLVFALSN